MGDRHGGRFARRGRALNPPRPQVDAHRGVGFRWRATVFRCRGVVGRICPRAGTLSSAKASRHGARAKGFAPRGNALLGEGLPTRRTSEKICPRRNTPLGEGLPTRRTSERICPAQKRSPRRRPPDTAHGRKDLPRGGARSPHMPTNGGPLSTDGQPKNTPSAGSHPQRVRPLPSSFTEKNKTTP